MIRPRKLLPFIDVCGQIVALAEALPESGERIAGTTMQLCFHLVRIKNTP
ncbi:MAG: hypothetical protein ACOWWR_12600 [Eubacteriales bacterium]